jgi:hypothetical protein
MNLHGRLNKLTAKLTPVTDARFIVFAPSGVTPMLCRRFTVLEAEQDGPRDLAEFQRRHANASRDEQPVPDSAALIAWAHARGVRIGRTFYQTPPQWVLDVLATFRGEAA